MSAIVLHGINRPALGAALAAYGLTIAAGDSDALAVLAAEGTPPFVLPGVIEVATTGAAVAALVGGADDVVLASDPDTLVAARIAALVRRRAEQALIVGDLAIDLVERRARRAGRPLPLLPREYQLLVHLARATGRIVSRAELTRSVLGLPFDPGTNVIAAHLSKLRGKLHDGFEGMMLLTEKGCGYRLVAAPVAG